MEAKVKWLVNRNKIIIWRNCVYTGQSRHGRSFGSPNTQWHQLVGSSKTCLIQMSTRAQKHTPDVPKWHKEAEVECWWCARMRLESQPWHWKPNGGVRQNIWQGRRWKERRRERERERERERKRKKKMTSTWNERSLNNQVCLTSWFSHTRTILEHMCGYTVPYMRLNLIAPGWRNQLFHCHNIIDVVWHAGQEHLRPECTGIKTWQNHEEERSYWKTKKKTVTSLKVGRYRCKKDDALPIGGVHQKSNQFWRQQCQQIMHFLLRVGVFAWSQPLFQRIHESLVQSRKLADDVCYHGLKVRQKPHQIARSNRHHLPLLATCRRWSYEHANDRRGIVQMRKIKNTEHGTRAQLDEWKERRCVNEMKRGKTKSRHTWVFGCVPSQYLASAPSQWIWSRTLSKVYTYIATTCKHGHKFTPYAIKIWTPWTDWWEHIQMFTNHWSWHHLRGDLTYMQDWYGTQATFQAGQPVVCVLHHSQLEIYKRMCLPMLLRPLQKKRPTHETK